MIDRMLQPSVADRQSSYQELIDELQAARSALVAREEALRARWSGPVRVLVSLGGLLILAAVGYGVFVGLHHLPDWRSHLRLPNDKAPIEEQSGHAGDRRRSAAEAGACGIAGRTLRSGRGAFPPARAKCAAVSPDHRLLCGDAALGAGKFCRSRSCFSEIYRLQTCSGTDLDERPKAARAGAAG